MRYGVLVTGPAGAGKTTVCSQLIVAAQAQRRSNVHLFNLDPAAERFEVCQPSIDIRELITLEDAMTEMRLGPNGGLVFCFEYLLENIDWLEEQLGSYEDDYLIIDCPGQIELYTHTPLISRLLTLLSVNFNFRLCALYMLEANFVDDVPKYFAGTLSAMCSMINLEVAHINVMSKMDLVKKGSIGDKLAGGKNRREMERYFEPDPLLLVEEANKTTNRRFHALNEALVQVIDDFSMVSFMPLDATDEDSVAKLLSHIDNALQYGEDEEPKEPKDFDAGGDFDEDE